jgi:hypothetical protein
MQLCRNVRKNAVKDAEILVNGAARLLQFEGASGWMS